MNVLLVSECDKNALTQTRRILDQFAERRGERTWATPITRDGLDTLRRLLRQSARKNTAVACHWIRGLDHSELLWVVGDRNRFNTQGTVPTNTTQRNILRANDENDWHSGQDIHLLSGLAALLHDLGKACLAFQMRLRGELAERNQYRHEWVSLRLFEAFVGNDDDASWLSRLANPKPEDDAAWLDWQGGRLHRDGLDPQPAPKPFVRLANAPLAQAIAWLVLTHHRLPVAPAKDDQKEAKHWLGKNVEWVGSPDKLHRVLEQVGADWNDRTDGSDPDHHLPLYWNFEPHGLPVTTEAWRKHAAKLAQRLLALSTQPGKGDWLGNPYVMHIARLSLMLADHHYSSLGVDKATGHSVDGRVPGQKGYPLFANTHDSVPRHSKGQSNAQNSGHCDPYQRNQTLDEHLLGVARHSATVTHALPQFETHLPRLGECKPLKKRAKDERFRWQNQAADLASTLRTRSAEHGAFIVNLASTGCGKTLGNTRVMYALADPAQGMRCAFAMGLRTLTLQTGRAFRDLLGLADDELAIRVGGSASRALFEHHERMAEQRGSASAQALVEEDGHVVFEGNHDAHPVLQRVLHDPQAAKLLVAPLLVCTIDHLTPATESQRGGRQIAPMLRLMSGDLVLDEPDDFDIADLPALTRLVHWAGLLGARVLLSSATLPPALVGGLFAAYRAGRTQFARNRGQRPGTSFPASSEASAAICCLWVDEFGTQAADCADNKTFSSEHHRFAAQRTRQLGQAAEREVRRRATLIPLDVGKLPPRDHPARFAQLAREAAVALHAQHHTIDPRSSTAGVKRISFGLIRMANIEPLMKVALALYQQGAPQGMRIHLCTYHSQYPLLLRSAIEQQLDQALNRRPGADGSEAVFSLPDIRQRIAAYPDATDHLFIVLGSPVTEVGRDHDYDWAVVEPSSMRSLIQLAGRVRRHRTGTCATPNLSVFATNLRHWKNHDPSKPAFCKPGFEAKSMLLNSHDLHTLLRPHERDVIDARPRLLAAVAPHFKRNDRLVDLEHACMRDTMLPNPNLLNAASWWHLPASDALLTAVLPQQQPFRHDNTLQVDLLLYPKDANEGDDAGNGAGGDYELQMLLPKPGGRRGETTFVAIDLSQNHRIPDEQVQGPGISPWGQTDYMAALSALAIEMDLTLAQCARRFGTVTLPKNDNGWCFHPALGFAKWAE